MWGEQYIEKWTRCSGSLIPLNCLSDTAGLFMIPCSHSRNNFWVREKKLSRDVSVTQLVCQKVVGRQKEDWEWTKLMWQGRWSGGRERTEIVCVSVNQDTVSREAWSIYLDFLFCKYIPIRNSQNLVTTKVSVTSQKSELSLHYKA